MTPDYALTGNTAAPVGFRHRNKFFCWP